MNAIDKLLPAANTALKGSPLVDTDNQKIKHDEYDGYLAGFGPAVIISGLIQTLATYVTDEKRNEVLNVIAEVAQIGNDHTGEGLLKLCLVPDNKHNLKIWRIKIIDASIALKMMIRTYKQQNN